MGLLEVVVQVDAGIKVMVSQEEEVTQQARAAKVAAAVTSQPPHKTPSELSTKRREKIFVAWNPGTPSPGARFTSHLPQSRHQAEVRKARTTAVRLCLV